MKNIKLIASTLILISSITAFSFSNWIHKKDNNIKCQAAPEVGCKAIKVIDPPTLTYSLSALTKNTVSKQTIQNAKTVSDLMPDFVIQENLKNKVITLKDVKINTKEENTNQQKKCSIKGSQNAICLKTENENILSKEQLQLLKNADYSSKFFLEGYAINNDTKAEQFFNYHLTVVPQYQANYKSGNEAFIEFVKNKCQPTIDNAKRGKLKNGNINFMITKEGNISNIEISSSCGYPSIDNRMLELIKNLPEGWNAAKDNRGEKVNQNLVFSYGQMGC